MSDEAKPQVYTVRCPKCNHPVFEEVLVDVTLSTKFRSGTLHPEEDFFDINYERAEEKHGGVIGRYQCDACGHVVAKTAEEFRTWIKEHGKK